MSFFLKACIEREEVNWSNGPRFTDWYKSFDRLLVQLHKSMTKRKEIGLVEFRIAPKHIVRISAFDKRGKEMAREEALSVRGVHFAKARMCLNAFQAAAATDPAGSVAVNEGRRCVVELLEKRNISDVKRENKVPRLRAFLKEFVGKLYADKAEDWRILHPFFEDLQRCVNVEDSGRIHRIEIGPHPF
jgi:hypothetical protein